MSKFEITSIKCCKYKEPKANGVVGVASIIINGSFLVNDIKLIKVKDKMFCGMPSKLKEDKTFMDICNPINHETRKYLENEIIAAYVNCQEEI